MKKMLLTLLLILSFNVIALTPYHSLDENDYYQVRSALKKYQWVANYAEYNFQYYSDIENYNKSDWHISAKTMFQRKKGDCEDWAYFYNDVLNFHNYNSEICYMSKIGSAHVAVVFKDEDDWKFLDVGGIKEGFETKNEAIYSYYGTNTTLVGKLEDFFKIDEDVYEKNKVNNIDIDRIELHHHLTKCNSGLFWYSLGFTLFEEVRYSTNYYKSLHKESIGYLYNLNKFCINKIGLSFSSHGYYSEFINSDYMYSFHLVGLDNRIGLTPYFGDYNGLDIDVNIFRSDFLKAYICFRNIYEVIDVECNIKPFKKIDFNINLEKLDKDYLYGGDISLLKDEGLDIRGIINNKQIGIEINMFLFKTRLIYNYHKLIGINASFNF